MRDYIKEINDIKQQIDHKGSKASGCGDSDYEFLIRYITKNKPKHIVEYGSGFSTWLIYNIIKDFNLDTRFDSYEDKPDYFHYVKTKLNIPKSTVNLVDVELMQVEMKNKTLQHAARYIHPELDYNTVDFMIIDGPADIGTIRPEITYNWYDSYKKTGRVINCWIDGRRTCKQFYQEVGFSSNIIHY